MLYEVITQYSNPEYKEIVKELKLELKNMREELGDTDEDFPGIKKIVESNWD